MSVTAINPSTAQASTAVSGDKSWSTNDVKQLKTLINEKMPIDAISQRLGRPVSAIRQEAALAGLKLGAGSADNSSAANITNPATGGKVDVRV